MPRAKELAKWEAPQPTLNEVRQQLGNLADDDELMLRYIAGVESVEAMRATPPRSELSIDASMPLVDMIKSLMTKPGASQIRIDQGSTSIHLLGSPR